MVDSGATFRKFRAIRKGSKNPTQNSYDIIFVHGLDSIVTDSIRKSAKSWLRSLDSPPGIETATIYTFGFKIADLLIRGRERLLELSLQLQSDVSRLKGVNLVFLGHGIAGWVIQAAFANYLGLEVSIKIRGIVFIGLPRFKDDGTQWKQLVGRYEGPFTKKGNLLTGLEFSLLQNIERNFLETKDYNHLVVEYVDLLEQHSAPILLPKRKSTMKAIREGTRLSIDSSKSRDIEAGNLSLPYITKGGKIDLAITKLLGSIMCKPETTAVSPSPLSNETQRAEQLNLPTPPSSPTFPEMHSQQSKEAMENAKSLHISQHSNVNGKYWPQLPITLEPSTLNAGHLTLANEAATDPGVDKEETASSNDVLIAGDRRWPQVMALSKLAHSYYQSGQLRQARRIYEDIIKEVETIDESNRDTLITLAEFQISIITLQQGSFTDAANELGALEVKAQRQLPKHDRTIWAIRRWLAISMDRQGRYLEAQQKLGQILKDITEARKAGLESDALAVAEMADLLTRDALALVLGHLGAYGDAITLSNDAIKAVKSQMEIGENTPTNKDKDSWRRRLSRFKANLASILVLSGDFTQAEAVNGDASKTMEHYMGVRCVATLECWSLEAQILVALGKVDEAESKCHKTLEWMRITLGKSHPSTLQTLGVLVSVYTSQASFTEARNTAKFLIEENKRVLGSSHPQTICAMGQLARICVARGELEKALPLQTQVVAMASKSLGAEHPSSLRYLSDLAMIHCGISEWSDARSLSTFAFVEQCKIFLRQFTGSKESTEPEDKTVDQLLEELQSQKKMIHRMDPRMFASMHCLGMIERERKSGNLDLALRFHTATVEFRKSKLGKEHPETLISQLQLAITQRRRGDFGSARKNVEEVMKSRIARLGQDHPDTLSARYEISLIQARQGKLIEACQDQSDILRLRNLLLGANHPDTIKSQEEWSLMFEQLHLQKLAAQLTPGKSNKDFSMLSEELKKQLVESVMEQLRDSAMIKGQELRFGVSTRHKAPLSAEAIASIKALVSTYVYRRMFNKAVDLIAVLNYHLELDFGYENNAATLEGMNQLASIYRMQAESQLAELAQADEDDNISAKQQILQDYCNTQSDLAFLYSNTGSLEAAHAVQANVLATLKLYKHSNDPLLKSLEFQAMEELAKTAKAMDQKA